MKIVVDANVFVSAAIAKGAPHEVATAKACSARFSLKKLSQCS